MASSQRVSLLIYRTSPSPSPSPLPSPSSYVCNNCRVHHQSISSSLRSRPLSSSSQARNSDRKNRNRNLPFTEKLRRKIWGTDNPPGLADPYGGPSFLERHWAQREQRYREKDETLAQREAADAAERELQLEEEERAREVGQQQQQPQQFQSQDPPRVLSGTTTRSRRRAGLGEAKAEKAETDIYVDDVAVDTNVDIADAEPGEYKPATTWDGLMHIGHAGHWQDIAPTEHDTYQPWFVKYDNSFDIDMNNDNEGSFPYFRATTREDAELLLRNAADHAGVELFTTTVAAEGEDEEKEAGEKEKEHLASQPLDLTNPATFQIIKSFRALTGFTFADSFLSSLARPQPDATAANATYADLITHYLDATTKAAPTNVYQSLVAKPELAAQPNVLIFPRRETPVDKDKEVGRWKVIEKELAQRGLPVLGRLDVSASSSSSSSS